MDGLALGTLGLALGTLALLFAPLLQLDVGGTAVMVRRRMARWRRGERTQGCRPTTRQHAPSPGHPSSRWVCWWLLKEPAELKAEERALVQALGDRCVELKSSVELARAFAAARSGNERTG
jgi:hypothetical protein